MLYLIDENFPPALARAIRKLHLRDRPDDEVSSMVSMGWVGVDDRDWIQELKSAGRPCTVITRDAMRPEVGLLQGTGVTWFLFNQGWDSMPFWGLSWKLIKV